MTQKLIYSCLIVLVMIIPSIFSNQMNRIDLQYGESKLYEFIDGNTYEINALESSKDKETVVQICSDSILHNICRLQEDPSFTLFTVSCWVFRDLIFPYEIKLQFSESELPCNLQINLLAFNKKPNKEGKIVFDPIQTKIGEIQQGQLEKNNTIQYDFSSPQNIENNKITITVKFIKGGLIPQLKPSCKNNDNCYISPFKEQRIVREMVILELEEAKGDITIELTDGGNEESSKPTSYRLYIQDNKSVLELSVSTSRFFLGENTSLSFSNLQTFRNYDDYNLFEVKVCEGSLSLAAQNSNRDLKTIGKNIWIFEKQDSSIINLQSRQDSYFSVQSISGLSKKLFLAITSPLEYTVKNNGKGVIIVQITPIMFDSNKVTISDSDSIDYEVYFFKNSQQRQSHTSCFKKNVEPKDQDYEIHFINQELDTEDPVIIDVNYSEKLGNFVEVIAQINISTYSTLTYEIVLQQKNE